MSCFCEWNWVILVLATVTALYYYGKWKNGYFKRKGLKSVKPKAPFIGNTWEMLLGKKHILDVSKEIYSTFSDERYVGYFEFTTPVIQIRDLELIKQITVKDFDHFVNHRSFLSQDIEPVFSRNLFNLQGEEWKDMRTSLSPAFTSSKMRNMFEFVEECAEQMAEHFSRKCKNLNKDKDYVDIELKNMFTQYTNDVIATAVFGIKINSLDEENNEFYIMGKEASNFTIFRIIMIFAYRFAPRIFKALNVEIFNKKVTNFFRTLIKGTMEEREKKGIVRHDMIHILMELKRGTLKHEELHDTMPDAGFATVEESSIGKRTIKKNWSDDDLAAQAMIFFIAGFDTSSTLLSFFVYEIVRNPEVQENLQKEIDEVASRIQGKLTYNDLQQLKYMDMVISETLRLWPPATSTDRVCVKPYSLPPQNDRGPQNYQLKVNQGVWIPILAIHRDPKYYPNPEKFDPERFSPENKSSIQPYSYIPFGIGPRNCIGSRFALMEVKAIIYHMLLNFDIITTAKTEIPIKLNNKMVTMHALNGFNFGLKARKNKSHKIIF